MKTRFKQHSVLPGFGLTFGMTLAYLGIIVLLPLSLLVLNTMSLSFGSFFATVTSPRVVASYKLSFGASLLAATINAVFGFIVAWTLIRYEFPGKRLLDAVKKSVVKNCLKRTIVIPVKDAERKESGNYEFSQDEVISDAYYSHQFGIPIISMLSPQMYLFHPMDTIEMVPKDELRKVGVTFAEIIDELM